jgi:hypothetical protein
LKPTTASEDTMPYTLFGLPTHILLIHAAVVGLPAACLATIAIAARPAWRRRYGLAVAGFDVLMVPLIYITMLAGYQLFNHVPYLQQAALQHMGLGRTLIWFVIVMAVTAVLLVAADRAGFADHHAVMVAIAGLAIAASAICAVRVVQVGDSGTRANWGQVVKSNP